MSIVLNSKPDYGWSEKNKDCIININNAKIYSERFTIGLQHQIIKSLIIVLYLKV